MKQEAYTAVSYNRFLRTMLVPIVVLLLIFCLSQAARAETTEDGRFLYEVYGGEVWITSYIGEGEAELIIPSRIDGMPVVSAALYRMAEDGKNYRHNTTVERIVLPESVTHINNNAFIYFEKLQEVEGLDHIVYLGSSAFVGTAIRELIFSEKLDTVTSSSFAGQTIEKIRIPDDLELEANPVVAPLFYYTWSLKEIDLIVTGNTPVFTKHGDALYTADMKTLICYPPCAEPLTYIIPDGVETIAQQAVYSDNGGDQVHYLMDLVIPDSVATIYRESFFWNSNIVTPTIRCAEGSYAQEYCQLWDWPYVTVDSTDNVQTIDEILEDAVSSCTDSGMTDYEKAYALMEWLCGHAVYDDSLTCYEAKDIIFRGTGVCQSYMLTYKMLLDRAGIENEWLGLYEMQPPHGANMVKIEDDWMIVDVTWCDPPIGYDLSINDIYFGMNHEMASKIYGVAIPEKYGTTAKWFKRYQDGEYDALIQALTGKINGLIASGAESLTMTGEYSALLEEHTDGNLDELFFIGYTVADRLNDAEWPLPARKVICTYDLNANSLTVMIRYDEAEEVPFEYRLEEGGICILGYTGTENDVVIPETIDGHPVISIGTAAFSEKEITSVCLPEGLKSVHAYAFYGCASLRSISFPASVTDLSDGNIMNGCSSLESLVIPGNVTALGHNFAYRCENLTTVHLSDTIVTIAYKAFGSCSSLSSIQLPAALETLGDKTFINCTSLDSVRLPEGLKSIGSTAFWGCEKLTGITLPDSLETLGEMALIGTSVTELYIPSGVREIGEIRCSAMKQLDIAPDNPYYKSVGNLVLSKDGKRLVTCANGISGIVEVPDGVEAIGEWALSSCENVEEFILPDSVREIGEYAFNNCRKLKRLTIPEGVVHLNFILGNTYDLEELHLPSTLKSIGDGAFSGITQLTEVVIPDGVEHLGTELFAHALSMSSVVIPKGVTVIDDHVFDMSYVDDIYIHENVTSIGQSEMLTTPTIHAEKGSAAEAWAIKNSYLFEAGAEPAATEMILSRSSLTLAAAGDFISAPLSVTFGPKNAPAPAVTWSSSDNSIVTVDKNGVVTAHTAGSAYITAVSSNGLEAVCLIRVKSRLNTLYLPESITVIGEEAFRSLGSAEAIVLPDGVTSIEAAAFADCTGVQFIVLPGSLETIAPDAFSGADQPFILCLQGSAAQQFAIGAGISHIPH